MENLDELMRHKFDNDDPAGRFEFREEYWEQAQALIEADEVQRRKKRRRLLWWACACALLVCAGAGLWWTVDGGRFTRQRLAGGGWTADGLPAKGLPTAGGRQRADDGDSIGSSDLRVGGKAANGGQDRSSDVTGENIKPTNSEKSTIPGNTNTSNKFGNQTLITKNSNAGAAKDQENTLSGKNTQKNKRTQNKDNRTSSDNSTDPKGLIAPAQTQVQNLSPDARKPEQGNTTPATGTVTTDATNAGNALPAKATAGGAHNAAAMAPDTTASAKSLDNLLKQLFALPLPFSPAAITNTPAIKIPVKTTLPMASQIKPVKDKPFSVGVAGAATTFQASPDRRWLGFSSGVFGAYRWNKSWSASLGLGVRYQPGNWIDSAGLELTNSLLYSFGFTSTQSERRAIGLLSVEIPVAAAWHHGALSCEAGVAPGRLIYALSRYKEVRETSLTSRKTVKNRLERGDTTPFGQLYVNTFASAAWRFSHNTSLFARGNYRLGNILKATTEDPAVKGGLSVDIGLRLNLF